MLEKIINSKSKTFLAFCFCFLLGVLTISVIDIRFNFVYLYLSLFISISFIIFFWSNKKYRFVFICALVFVGGIVRYQLAFPFSTIELPNYKTEITGYVSDETDVRLDGVNYIFKIFAQGGSALGGKNQKLYFKSTLYPRYNYGDELKINCQLQRPEALPDFRYDMYLAKQGVFLTCYQPQIEKIGERKGLFILRGIYWLKNKAAEQVKQLWPEPYASFMAGLLYGYRGGLGDLTNDFNRTGVTHIIAISGYNISIISVVLLSCLGYLYIPRKKAFWLVVGGIILFTIFAGAGGSVIRAGLMGILVLLAKQIGRLSRIFNVMIFTAVLMVLFNPLVLVWDAGFQLSFVAMIGIIYVSPLVGSIIPNPTQGEGSLFNTSKKVSGKALFCTTVKGSLVSLGIIETISAIIATLPLILYQFGRLSIVAPIVNILILWIIPFLMLFGFLAVIFSFVFYPLGQVIAWIGLIGLKYVIIIVQWFSGLKFVSLDLTIPWWVMITAYLFMIYLCQKKSKF